MTIQPPTAQQIADEVCARVDALVQAHVTTPDMGLSRSMASSTLYSQIITRLMERQPDAYLGELFREYSKASRAVDGLGQDDPSDMISDFAGHCDWLVRQLRADAGVDA